MKHHNTILHQLSGRQLLLLRDLVDRFNSKSAHHYHLGTLPALTANAESTLLVVDFLKELNRECKGFGRRFK